MKPTRQQTEPHRAKSALTLKSVERAQQARVPSYHRVKMPTRTANLRAMSVDSRQGAKCVVDGPIGFRSGADPEAKHEVEHGVSVSRESRGTINQTKPKQLVLAHNQETHNYKPNSCKQIKRNSFELAESHRLFTVENKEKTRRVAKMSSNVPERAQNDETEFIVNLPFRVEGAPILTDQTQISVKPHKATSSHIKPHKATSSHIKPHKATLSHIKPHPGKVVVLTDVPSGSPSPIAQDQVVVNTVGPVPSTFGYGLNTFPHSAAHVLNINHVPSSIEGEPTNKIHTSAALSQNLSGLTKTHQSLKFSGTDLSTFTLLKKVF